MVDARLRRNMPPLGAVNPALYLTAERDPGAFNDILIGDNRCTGIAKVLRTGGSGSLNGRDVES